MSEIRGAPLHRPAATPSGPVSGADGLQPTYPLRTARLDLRPHRTDDLDDLVRFHSKPDVVRYVPWPVRDRRQTRAALELKVTQTTLTEPGQWLVLAIELRETATAIGEVLLKWSSRADRQGEIGCALDTDHHGRGLAREAVWEMLRLGFEELHLHRITAVCVEGNVASRRLLERLGMTCEAHLVDSIFFKGDWASQFVYAIREDVWRARCAADRGPTTKDADTITGLVRRFFAAFVSGPESAARMADLRAMFLPGALIVRACGSESVAYDVESFIAPRQALLEGGSLVDFAEWPVTGRVEIFGDIAHWFGRYAKNGTLDDEPYTGSGMKSLQLVRTADGWKISAAAWDDERAGLGLGAYLEVPYPSGPGSAAAG